MERNGTIAQGMSSEVWEDIGNRAKPKKAPEEKASIYQSWKPITRHSHESEETTADRRGKRLEAIFRVFPNSTISDEGMVISVIQNRKFEFWPGSDCWFSYAKQTYGYGIERLLKMIEEKLKDLNS